MLRILPIHMGLGLVVWNIHAMRKVIVLIAIHMSCRLSLGMETIGVRGKLRNASHLWLAPRNLSFDEWARWAIEL